MHSKLSWHSIWKYASKEMSHMFKAIPPTMSALSLLFRRDRPDIPKDDQYPLYESVIRRNRASFTQLVEVLYGSEPDNCQNDSVAHTNLSYCPYIFRAFEKANGGVLQIYRCKGTKTAAVLTEREFFTHYQLTP